MIGRMIRTLELLVLLFASTICPLQAQDARPSAGNGAEEQLLAAMHTISSHTILDWVKELSSEKYRGRLTGTPEYDAAAQWAAGLFADWKIKPLGDNGTYFQKFPNPYTLVLPGAELILRIPAGNLAILSRPYLFEQDFFPGSTSDSGFVTAEVFYVGYGITAPELKFDEYEGMDVRGRIVLVEPEVPITPDRDADEFKKWRPYSFHDYKVQNAKKHGAAGMVYDYHITNPNCVFIKDFLLTYVGRTVVDDLFAGAGKKHEEVVQSIRSARKPSSFATGKTLTIKNVTEHHPEGIGSNLIAYLEGSDPVLKQETIVMGAHLDHVGMNHELMPGANDNASGVAVLLAAAEALAGSGLPRRRSVLFLLFGAEEQGVRGSEYYVIHPAIPKDRVKGFINLESVGRGERISAGAARNYPRLWEFFDRSNRRYLHRSINPVFTANLARPRQDAAHFLWAGIPTISFGTSGGKPLPFAAYHTTKDRPEFLSPEIMEDLARLLFLAVQDMANSSAVPAP